MNKYRDYTDHDIEPTNLKPSRATELVLIQLRVVLYGAPMRAEDADEVEIISDSITELTLMASFYSFANSTVPESFGVDLNEACIMKQKELTRFEKSEWRTHAEMFKNSLMTVAEDLGIDMMELSK